jgi:hypothetical protein
LSEIWGGKLKNAGKFISRQIRLNLKAKFKNAAEDQI